MTARRTRRRALAGGALVLVALLAALSSGADATPYLYVDRSSASCSDGGAGARDEPFCTIGAAAARVAAGQTVQVAAGTYREAVTVRTSGTSGAPVTFTAAPGAAVALGGRANGFVISGRSWVVVIGFEVSGTSGYGISVTSSSHVTLSHNHVSGSGRRTAGLTRSGLYLSDVSDSEVSSNTVDHNSSYGIDLVSGSTRTTLRLNLSSSNSMGYHRAASGIRVYGSPGNAVLSNVCHDNEDSGIEFDTGAGSSLIAGNVTYANGDHGIDSYRSTGQRIVGNTVYANVTAGINVEAGSTGATLAGNLSVDNGIASPRTPADIRVDRTSVPRTTMDYDQVHLGAPGVLLIWGPVDYPSLTAFRSATGQEAHGIEDDPRWRDPEHGDFRLTPGSRAIDSADSGVAGEPSVDAAGNGRVDDPATGDRGAGPRSYDDRGAYEFRPAGTAGGGIRAARAAPTSSAP